MRALDAQSERDATISQNSGLQKEKDEQYSLGKIDFNPINRITKIEIIASKQYRTIERYVTRDYVKYPVYSGWKTKTRVIKKTIKLTNAQLENLAYNEDELIVMLAKDIISQLPADLHPSWYNYYYLDKALDYELNLIDKSTEKIKARFYSISEKIDNNKDLLIKIYSKAQKGNKEIVDEVSVLNEIDTYFDNLPSKTARYAAVYLDIALKRKDYIKQMYAKKRASITFLSDEVVTDEFIPLAEFAGFEKEKIIGCYVIWNVELNKYYVGQSKDVLKRITQQHFNGTKPKNIIFAEDYFNSKINKDELFKVKIIPLDTKDELDATEKELIEEYDSFAHGYNGTAGNK